MFYSNHFAALVVSRNESARCLSLGAWTLANLYTKYTRWLGLYSVYRVGSPVPNKPPSSSLSSSLLLLSSPPNNEE